MAVTRVMLLLVAVLLVACSDDGEPAATGEPDRAVSDAGAPSSVVSEPAETMTPTMAATPSPTRTPTVSPTATPTPTPTATPTLTPTQTPTPSPTPTPIGGSPYLLVPRRHTDEAPGDNVSLYRVGSDGSQVEELISAATLESLLERPVAKLYSISAAPGGDYALLWLCFELAGGSCPSRGTALLDLRSERVKFLDDSVEGGHILGPEWSPDGSRALLEVSYGNSPSSNHEIYVLDSGTGEIVNATNSPALDQSAYWAGDSDRIIWNIYRRGNWMMNADGSDQRLLDEEAIGNQSIIDLQYSDDGRLAAYLLRTIEELLYDTVVVINSELETSQVFATDGQYSRIVWSPDNASLLTVMYDFGSRTWRHLFLDATTGEAIEVALPSGAKVCGWSPDGQQLLFLDSTDNDNVGLMPYSQTSGTPHALTDFDEEPPGIGGSNQSIICPTWP